MADSAPASSSARGSCLCGAVRFEADLPPRFVAHCHCENCTRAHGAPFVTWAGFPNERFRITAGADDLVAYRTDTGADRSFCKTCGTTLLYASPRWPGEVHVAAIAFTDPLHRAPMAHVYADRAPAWCPITDGLPRFGGPSGMERLGTPAE